MFPRFFVDATGSYDLAAVSAVTPGGVHNTAVAGGSNRVAQLAVLHLEGGETVSTASLYADVAKAWQNYLEEQEAGKPVTPFAAEPAPG